MGCRVLGRTADGAEEAPLPLVSAANAVPAVARASPPASKRRDSDMSYLLIRNVRRLRRLHDQWETRSLPKAVRNRPVRQWFEGARPPLCAEPEGVSSIVPLAVACPVSAVRAWWMAGWGGREGVRNMSTATSALLVP